MSSFEEPPHFGIKSVWHFLHQPFAARVPQGFRHPLVVGRDIRPAHDHVFTDGQFVTSVILKQHTDPAAKRVRIKILYINASNTNRTLTRIVKANDQLDKRSLARS